MCNDGPPRILIIDDDSMVRELLTLALEEEGFEILVASSGEEGIDIFRDDRDIDLVLTDLMMPGMSGIDVLDQVREIDPLTEVVVLTGFGVDEIALEAMKKGAYDYLQKPVNLRELLLTIDKALEKRRITKENLDYQKRLARRNTELENTLHELRDTQAQLIQSEKLASIGQLAAGMAHEINNPIGFINSNLSTLLEYSENIKNVLDSVKIRINNDKEDKNEFAKTWRKGKMDDILEDLENIVRESLDGTGRIKSIVQNLKDFSNLDRAQIQETNIEEELERVLNIISNEFRLGIEVHREFGGVREIKCNRQQINQVLLNLLINAVQAIEKPDGKIILHTRELNNNRICIEVKDNGVGISDEATDHIFDPFFTTKDVGQGTGLGLAISYNIVKDHDGEISVSSEPGKGTTFQVILPVEGKKKS